MATWTEWKDISTKSISELVVRNAPNSDKEPNTPSTSTYNNSYIYHCKNLTFSATNKSAQDSLSPDDTLIFYVKVYNYDSATETYSLIEKVTVNNGATVSDKSYQVSAGYDAILLTFQAGTKNTGFSQGWLPVRIETEN